jgi:hypothetical protein
LQEKYVDILLLSNIAVGYASLLAGLTISEDSFTTLDGSVNEDNYLRSKNNGLLVDNWYQGMKVLLFTPIFFRFDSNALLLQVESLYMFGLYKEALEHGDYYMSIVGSLMGHPHEPRGVSYYILAVLAAAPSKIEEDPPDLSHISCSPNLFPVHKITQEEDRGQDDVIKVVMESFKHVELWVNNSINFRHYGILIQAEMARVQGYHPFAFTL